MAAPVRTRNPFTASRKGGRALSALMLPWFWLLPPAGYGVLTTTGRRTGKARRRCIRAIRRGDRAFIAPVRPEALWVKNLQANPQVRLRIRGGSFRGVARELVDPAERREALAAYAGTVHRLDFASYRQHRRGRPTREKIQEMHRGWFETGPAFAIDLER